MGGCCRDRDHSLVQPSPTSHSYSTPPPSRSSSPRGTLMRPSHSGTARTPCTGSKKRWQSWRRSHTLHCSCSPRRTVQHTTTPSSSPQAHPTPGTSTRLPKSYTIAPETTTRGGPCWATTAIKDRTPILQPCAASLSHELRQRLTSPFKTTSRS